MTATALKTTTVAGIEVPTDHYIGGRRVGSDATFQTLSPLDGRVLAEVAREKMDLAPMPGHEIDGLLGRLYAIPSDVVAKAAAAIAE